MNKTQWILIPTLQFIFCVLENFNTHKITEISLNINPGDGINFQNFPPTVHDVYSLYTVWLNKFPQTDFIHFIKPKNDSRESLNSTVITNKFTNNMVFVTIHESTYVVTLIVLIINSSSYNRALCVDFISRILTKNIISGF